MPRSATSSPACERAIGRLVPALFVLLAIASQAGGQTVVQLPTFGVAVDADGTLRRTLHEDPTGSLAAARASAASRTLPADLSKATLRVVSLRRLDEALARFAKEGSPVDDAAVHLAGLQSIRYVFVIEKTDVHPGDVLIAGFAEGWFEDLSGRAIGLTTRAPTLLLEDLATALTAYPATGEDASFVGCTIDPRIEGLARLAEFQRTIPHAIPAAQRIEAAGALREGVAQSLGLADIRTFGVEQSTHLARTLIEADYRMKSIGVGIEPPPVQMTTYAGALGGPDPGLVRWWFEPDYERLLVDEARLSMEAVGAGLKLSAEDRKVASDGTLVPSPDQPSAAARRYAESFTSNYQDIARRSPVFAELRNVVELLVAAAFLKKHGGYDRSGETFDEIVAAGKRFREDAVAPKQVPCVANAFWKGVRLIIPAGGGVSIEPLRALEPSNAAPFENSRLVRDRIAKTPAGDAWWWNTDYVPPYRATRLYRPARVPRD